MLIASFISEMESILRGNQLTGIKKKAPRTKLTRTRRLRRLLRDADLTIEFVSAPFNP